MNIDTFSGITEGCSYPLLVRCSSAKPHGNSKCAVHFSCCMAGLQHGEAIMPLAMLNEHRPILNGLWTEDLKSSVYEPLKIPSCVECQRIWTGKVPHMKPLASNEALEFALFTLLVRYVCSYIVCGAHTIVISRIQFCFCCSAAYDFYFVVVTLLYRIAFATNILFAPCLLRYIY